MYVFLENLIIILNLYGEYLLGLLSHHQVMKLL
jgi:hypothetical protein